LSILASLPDLRYHLSITYTADSQPSYYINGIQNTTMWQSGIQVTPSYWGADAFTAAYIGRSGLSTGNYLEGQLKDFRIYSHALRCVHTYLGSFA
jgi:hypothetical protein